MSDIFDIMSDFSLKKEPYKVLVCGGRIFSDKDKVYSVLNLINKIFDNDIIIIQGGATGADSLAKEWAADNCVICITENVNWDLYGKKAGPIRNQLMLDKHKPDIVIAFPGGNGTADMINRSIKNNFKVVTM
jgi:predicted Rossmann-fold nucleotide-binding protein